MCCSSNKFNSNKRSCRCSQYTDAKKKGNALINANCNDSCMLPLSPQYSLYMIIRVSNKKYSLQVFLIWTPAVTISSTSV